jgi:hypothetical protein
MMDPDKILAWTLFALEWSPAYFTPAVIAVLCKHRRKRAVIVANFLFGWMILGWLAVFVWSLTAVNLRDEPAPGPAE